MSSPAPVINTTSAEVEPSPNPETTPGGESGGDSGGDSGGESGITINLKYATTPIGILKILQSVFGLVAWSLVASSHTGIASHQFVLFVTITSWITTVISLFVSLCGCHTGLCSWVPCMIIDFIFNTFWAVFYILAACVIAAFTNQVPQLIAGTAFSFFVAVLYTLHALFVYREWRGDYPWN